MKDSVRGLSCPCMVSEMWQKRKPDVVQFAHTVQASLPEVYSTGLVPLTSRRLVIVVSPQEGFVTLLLLVVTI